MANTARPSRGWMTALVSVALTSVLVGCGGKDYNSNSATNRPVTTAFMRLVNAVPDSPVLFAGVDGTTLTRVAYGQATGLVQVPSGKYVLDALYVDPNGAQVPVINKEVLNLAVDDQDTTYLIGTLAAPRVKLVENAAPNIAAGNAEVQVVQVSAKAGSVDVYLTDANVADADLGTATALATSVAYEDATPLTTVTAGNNYRLRVTPAGDPSQVRWDSGVFALPSGNRITFVVVDYFGPPADGFRVLYQDSQVARLFPNEALPAQVRFANMISDQASVDVYVGAVDPLPRVFSGVDYGKISALTNVPPGPLKYNITPANDPTVLGTGSIDVTAGDTRTIFATRSASGIATNATVDSTRSVANEAQITVVQAAPSALATDAFFVPSGSTLSATVSDIVNQPPLSVASARRMEASSPYNVVFTPTGDKTTAHAERSLPVVDGGIYSVYLIDAAGGGPPYQIVFGSD